MEKSLIYTKQMYQLLGGKTTIFFPGLDTRIGFKFFHTPNKKAYKLLELFGSQFRDDYPKFEECPCVMPLPRKLLNVLMP